MPTTRKETVKAAKTTLAPVARPRKAGKTAKPLKQAERKPAMPKSVPLPTKPVLPPAPAAAPRPAAPPPAEPRKPRVSPEQKFRMIQEAAYLIAEKDGFAHHPDQYWVAAERQIAAALAKG